jgi:Trk-type K+ transport system membrane component
LGGAGKVGIRSRSFGKNREKSDMAAVLLILLLAIILGGLGFAVHVLWWIALAVLVLWVLGWAIGAGEAGGRRRWYGRW